MADRFADKAAARQAGWDALVATKAARFPFPTHRGRIPNFAGAKQAAERLLAHPIFRAVKCIKVNPDTPRRYGRDATLKRCFVPGVESLSRTKPQTTYCIIPFTLRRRFRGNTTSSRGGSRVDEDGLGATFRSAHTEPVLLWRNYWRLGAQHAQHHVWARYDSLIEAIRSEGLEEFANALLAFYIVAVSVAHHGNLGDTSEILEHAKLGQDDLGADMVLRALALAGSFATENGHTLVLRKIENFLGKQSRQELDRPLLRLVETVARPTPKTAENLLREVLGERRWEMLAKQSRENLTTAELQWVTFSKTENFTWGGVAVEFMKPIEHEIRLRFEEPCRDYPQLGPVDAHQQHIDLVRILLMLKKTKKADFPELIRAQIERVCSRLPHLPDLLQELITTYTKYRNPGAHPNAYPEDILKELHDLLFRKDGGLLLRFIDALEGPAKES